VLVELAKAHDRQALITTHAPAILDGLDLRDEDQRLFAVSRDDAGHTLTKRLLLKTRAGKPKVKQAQRRG
jgi:hypothetical protein